MIETGTTAMTYGGWEALRLLAAVLAYVPLLLLPGMGIAAGLDLLGFRGLPAPRQWLLGTLAGLALLPLVDSLLIRSVGPDAALALQGLVALAGFAWILRVRPSLRMSRRAVLVLAAWTLVVVFAWVDVEGAAGLQQPLLVLDGVKHVATTRAIAASGAPPIDPFFAREERAGYYFFFYALPALATTLGRSIIDARAAFCGLVVWTGIGLVALLDLILDRSGFVPEQARPRAWTWTLALLPAAGLDIAPVVRNAVTTGIWLPMPESWNEPIVWFVPSLLWVPHHVCALLAAWLGFLSLAEALDCTRGGGRPATTVLVAGAAFASCAGLSIWVALGAAGTMALWAACLAAERRWRAAATLMASGLAATAFALPYLLDLLANRADGRAGITLTIRRFGPLESLPLDPKPLHLARLALLPLNYYVEFGLFASGAILFWRVVARSASRSETARVLKLSLIASLALGSFLSSTLINNDLGWRIVLFAQLSAFIWTVAALSGEADQPTPARGRRPYWLIVALFLGGYATTAYGLVMLRAYPASGMAEMRFFNARPDVDRELRDAYWWANLHLAPDLVLQHDPAPERVFDFGLYSRHRVGVADAQAMLFGASASSVAQRVNDVLPVFMRSLPPQELRERAGKAGIDALVVSAQDPVWSDPASWVWSSKAAYASPLVRIVLVGDL